MDVAQGKNKTHKKGKKDRNKGESDVPGARVQRVALHAAMAQQQALQHQEDVSVPAADVQVCEAKTALGPAGKHTVVTEF